MIASADRRYSIAHPTTLVGVEVLAKKRHFQSLGAATLVDVTEIPCAAAGLAGTRHRRTYSPGIARANAQCSAFN
jgi:hypothetical protein